MVAKLREKVAKDWPVGWLEKVILWKIVSGSSSWNTNKLRKKWNPKKHHTAATGTQIA